MSAYHPDAPMLPTPRKKKAIFTRLPGQKAPVSDITLPELNIISYNRNPALNSPGFTEMARKGPSATFVGYRNKVVYVYEDPYTGEPYFFYGPLEESSYD